jgi:FkbM family methyltransferase
VAERLRDLMPAFSKMRYLAWRALRFPPTITARLSTGETLVVRRAPAGDLGVAYEVFVAEFYRSPRPLPDDSMKLIVDVGANVGYSVSYLARCYPNSRIEAFEPHPVHVRALVRNVKANRLDARVKLHSAAAGVRACRGYLHDFGACSSVVEDAGPGLIPIEIIDFFDCVDSKTIDLLKLDCEGGEYDIIMDPRFEKLDVRCFVVEWHLTLARPHADREILQRLRALDWQLEPVFENRAPLPRFGMLGSGIVWGYR